QVSKHQEQGDYRMKKWILLFPSLIIMTACSVDNQENNANSIENENESDSKWELVYQEDFEDFDINEKIVQDEWIHDDLASEEDNRWNVDHLDDNGKYFEVRQGQEFYEKLEEMKLYR